MTKAEWTECDPPDQEEAGMVRLVAFFIGGSRFEISVNKITGYVYRSIRKGEETWSRYDIGAL